MFDRQESLARRKVKRASEKRAEKDVERLMRNGELPVTQAGEAKEQLARRYFRRETRG